jgi:transcriptional regulator with XRE-family HTH domain
MNAKETKNFPIKISMAAARINAGLTQKQLAIVCGVSESTVVNWENGKRVPSLRKLPLLEKAYGISLDYVKMPC